MNVIGKEKCQRCGALIPSTSTDKLCPACLLSGALKLSDDETATIGVAPAGPLSLQGPSGFPCEFGGYRLLGLLGRGGMGAVYEAEQLSTGRRLALKMLGRQIDSPDMRQRFLREGRLAARVNHPNSLYIFGSEEIEGHPVITMEIVGGGTLKDQLKQRGPLPVKEAVDAILDVISGLEAAFANGVLHRDVKPSNCFVSPDGSVKVGDFGLSVSTLAKTDTFATAHGMKIMGTPAFASPEQLRGDTLDVRADIYSVGATLFTLLTDRPPFEGDNAVQVVANAVNQDPPPLHELRKDVPPALAGVVRRCLAKEPDRRYTSYSALRDALLPFSSREPEPASIKIRASAGWIDYLIAFLPAYVTLMFVVGAEDLLYRPVVERTLYSARYYFLFFGIGFLYFSIFEGIWGAGLGMWLKGLQVVRRDGRRPGVGRAFLRIFIPILSVEGIRMPLSMVLLPNTDWTVLQSLTFIVIANVCGWIPALLTLTARRENGFATVWDLASGTRVIVKPKGTKRPSIEPVAQAENPPTGANSLGPYQIIEEMIPGKWIVGVDPVLRRPVWLLRTASEVSRARRDVARSGRLRWLQKVEADGAAWDAFEALPGVPFSDLAGGRKHVPWSNLRHWLHDLAAELWAATGDETLPAVLSLDYVWITADGRAVLLDEPWPHVKAPAGTMPVGDLAGQQRFLSVVAACVESTGLPLHARPVLRNLKEGKLEKLSFLTGTLRGLLDRPAEVGRGIRAGAIFLLPLYIWIMFFVGYFQDKPLDEPLRAIVFVSAVIVAGAALTQLLELPFRSTVGLAIFRLAVINDQGAPASRLHLLVRWAVIWLPLLLPAALVTLLLERVEGIAVVFLFVLLLLWVGAAAYAVVNPHRGFHDRLARTWVVRQ
jgi:eukaryotic-like serine/threonine-protein kinase